MINKNTNKAVFIALSLICPVLAFAQSDMPPTNDFPNPYITQEGYFDLPAGRTWGSSSTVDIDLDGESVWVAERCGANINACANNPDVNMIMLFDKDGNLLRSFGAGYITWPHGIHVDHDGNVWVADARGTDQMQDYDGEPWGHQVHKFSPTGVHLLTLGSKGGGRDEEYFYTPNDMHVAPDGSIFVGEGHSSAEGTPNRVLKFDADGNYLFSFGEWGMGPGQFRQPHGLAMDSKGRLFVADRGNDRIQIFDQDGNFIDMWYQFSRNSGIYIDDNDVLYAADSESGSVNPDHSSWTRGIRVGSAITGEVEFLIPDPQPDCRGTCTAEGVVADKHGNIFGAEVGPVGGIKRYVRPAR
ncbi:MAG: 6-bladed beta-propeller [Proteobacteria bacterium]|nr:6-bladed beta-propeller [Pseudomonadota bacterium]